MTSGPARQRLAGPVSDRWRTGWWPNREAAGRASVSDRQTDDLGDGYGSSAVPVDSGRTPVALRAYAAKLLGSGGEPDPQPG